MTKQQIIDKLAGAKEDLRRLHVTKLELFGSVVRDEAGPDSDVDFLVEFEPGFRVTLFRLAETLNFLEDLLGCKVDLVMRDSVYEPLRENIFGEAIRVA